MREIKFRAWNKTTNEMMDSITIQELAGRPQLNETNVSNLIFEQFTGLQDKNGKDIYEGDTLNWDYDGTTEFNKWMKEPLFTVEYEDGYTVCGIGIKNKLYLHGFRFKHTEITGNIHDQ